jgi:hypothetical protein
MWFPTAATTTHGTAVFFRQFVCRDFQVNFSANFGLPKDLELCPERKISRPASVSGAIRSGPSRALPPPNPQATAFQVFEKRKPAGNRPEAGRPVGRPGAAGTGGGTRKRPPVYRKENDTAGSRPVLPRKTGPAGVSAIR